MVLKPLLAALALASGAVGLVDRREAPSAAPPRLSATGLYRRGSAEVDPANLPYAPQYPLWSDGAEKARWIFLPPGSRIDARDPDGWVFPVGAKLWKQFSFGGRRAETRFMWRKGPAEWVFATYRWREDQQDADLAPAAGAPGAAEVAPGRFHSLPSLEDCRSCHGAARVEVLGFNALQLSPDRDPLAPHAEPLKPGMPTTTTLAQRGLLLGGEHLVLSPMRIPAASPRARAVLGYLSSNCGSCHQPSNPIPHVSMDLRHRASAQDEGATAVFRTAVGRKAYHGLPDREPGTALLVAPGDPDHSLLLHRMATRSPSTQMPPLGTVLADEEAVRLMRAWISEDLAAR